MNSATTRIDTSKRLELLSNRLTFLNEKIEEYEQQRKKLSQEYAKLKDIELFYTQNPDDDIDKEREEIFQSVRNSTPKRGRIVESILSVLEPGKKTSVAAISKQTGLTNNQASNACGWLVKAGKLEKTGRAEFRLANS